jgi:hypothetical protein
MKRAGKILGIVSLAACRTTGLGISVAPYADSVVVTGSVAPDGDRVIARSTRRLGPS